MNYPAFTLSQAIALEGFPTLKIALESAKAGLVVVADGEGYPHFTWNQARLDRHSVKFLEALLVNLREANKEVAKEHTNET